MSGKCVCYSGYTGEDCGISIKKCPNDCSGTGKCREGICDCEKSYYSEDCSRTALNCLNSGYFNYTSLECQCKDGFYGDNCEKKKCLNNCSENGLCLESGICQCNQNFKGYDCSISKFF